MINFIEKSVSASHAEGKSNNLLTGRPFNPTIAIRAVHRAIYLAASSG